MDAILACFFRKFHVYFAILACFFRNFHVFFSDLACIHVCFFKISSGQPAIIIGSVLLNLSFLTNENIEQIPIENEDIISLIRKLNPNKVIGSDGICVPSMR